MKKQILAGLLVSVMVASCTKSTIKTEQVENPDGSVTTTTTVTENTGLVDTSKVNEARQNAKVKAHETGEKIDAAAQKTKQDLKEAGKDLKEAGKEIGNDVKDAAAKGASKVEEGARKLKEDLKK
ncbi:hypothetical protein [Chryseobacterium camelliae]|uniref:hypothetical protein n=1 Tax=Chryseobacterium camelliae TaxID=1265445 RepID=UPI0028597C5A|nr:hypothetical protein [Chryseobacterium camelliae]MDR6514917.1 putative small secreted protein [Chryseobacterium camelliae]